MSDDKIPTYDEMNREKFSARKKIWAQNNREKVRIANKKWREKNRDYLKKKQHEYYHGGYYKKKLLERFEVLKNEVLIGNDSLELLEEFKEILNEMLKYNLIDDELFNNLITLI